MDTKSIWELAQECGFDDFLLLPMLENFASRILTQRPAAQTEPDHAAEIARLKAVIDQLERREILAVAQQTTPEPVGEVVAYREKLTGRLCEPEDTHRRKFPMCYEPLTRPAPGVPEDVQREIAAAQAKGGENV